MKKKSIIFSLLCSLVVRLGAEPTGKELVENKILNQLKLISGKDMKLISSKEVTTGIVLAAIQEQNKTSFNTYYLVKQNALVVGSIFIDGKEVGLEADNVITKEIQSIKKVVEEKKSQEKARVKKLSSKFTNSPSELISRVKEIGNFVVINKKAKKGEVLLVLSPGCKGCKKLISDNVLVDLIEKGFTIVLYVPTNKIETKLQNCISFKTSQLPEQDSDSQKIKKIKEYFSSTAMTCKQTKNFEKNILSGHSFTAEQLINAVPAVVIVGNHKNKKYFEIANKEIK